MRTLGVVCSVVVGLAIGSCGDDPEDQCRELFEVLCDKIAECLDGEDGLSASEIKTACLKPADSTCSNVGEPKGDVDACIDSIEESSCEELLPDGGDGEAAVPNDCMP